MVYESFMALSKNKNGVPPNLDYFVIIFPINMNMWWIDIGTPKQIERQFLYPFLFLLVHPLGVVISHFQTIPFVHRGER